MKEIFIVQSHHSSFRKQLFRLEIHGQKVGYSVDIILKRRVGQLIPGQNNQSLSIVLFKQKIKWVLKVAYI